jgi:hypothetical protein
VFVVHHDNCPQVVVLVDGDEEKFGTFAAKSLAILKFNSTESRPKLVIKPFEIHQNFTRVYKK